MSWVQPQLDCLLWYCCILFCVIVTVYQFSQHFVQGFLYYDYINVLKSVRKYVANICGTFLLRKIALPYPHKCLLGFVEAKRGDQQEYLKIILVREVNPVVSDRCACAQHIVGWTLSRDPHSIFGRRGGNT